MRRPRYPRTAFGLQMTPMIDVAFQLLIFFVATVEFLPPEDVLLTQLPGDGSGPRGGKTPEELDLGTIQIQITTDAILLQFQGKQYKITEPEQSSAIEQCIVQLREWAKIEPAIPVDIACGDEVATGILVRVHDACRRAGLKKIRTVENKKE